jgi:hypothetical protein
MGFGGAHCPRSATAILLLTSAPSALASIWTVNIDESPAPSPAEGPPFSAHASRNRALLPFEIIAVVGSYFACACILGLLLLTVARRSRRRALDMSAKPVEMVKPARQIYDPSPVSPRSDRSWYSPRRVGKKSAPASIRSGMSDNTSPAMESVVSFDRQVVEADRRRGQEEMERLYAAVMAQDENRQKKASSAVNLATMELPPPPDPPGYGQPQQPQQQQQRQQQQQKQQKQGNRPPRLITDAPALGYLQRESQQFGPRSPGTPKSPVRAIYPPDSPMPPMPTSPTSPIRAEYPNTPLTPQFFAQAQGPNASHAELRPGASLSHRESRTSSFGSGSGRTVGSGSGISSTSLSGGRRGLRTSLRNLKISAPLHLTSTTTADDNSDGARTPLSPRFYTEPGIPPEPPTARTLDSQAGTIPPTPGTARSWAYRPGLEGEEGGEEGLDEVRALPMPYPSKMSMSAHQYANAPQIVTTTLSTRPDPPAPAGERSPVAMRYPAPQAPAPAPSGGAGTAGTAGTANRPLPLRQMALQQQAAQQHQQPHPHPQQSPGLVGGGQGYHQNAFPLSPSTWNAPPSHPGAPSASAGPIQTTFLSPLRPNFPGAGGPRTGLATPYSPYMPFTPLTPVTPGRLLSRAERRAKEKEDRKRGLGLRSPVMEEDAVKDEGEIWGEGWE